MPGRPLRLTFRDREAPGSNPGPPTSFVFKTGDFARRRERADHSRVTNFLGNYRDIGVRW